MRRLVSAVLACGLALAGAASAQPAAAQWTYFNRAGATYAEQRADLEACYGAIDTVIPRTYASPPTNPVYIQQYGLGGALGSAMAESEYYRMAVQPLMRDNYESCMVVRGWRVVRLDEAMSRELGRLSGEELARRLEPLVGADPPPGTIAREPFDNSGATNVTVTTGPTTLSLLGPPASLSLRALPDSMLAPPARRQRAAIGGMSSEQVRERARERREIEETRRADHMALFGREDGQIWPTTPSSITLDPQSAVIVISSGGPRFQLVRSGGAGDTAAGSYVAVESNAPAVFVVPPGHWRISGLANYGPGPVSFCLGAPGFDVVAGDVVYAGDFAYGAVVDLSLERAQAALADVPALAAQLRPAAYTNGETFGCDGGASLIYAFEVDGAPFAENYRWGSRAPGAVRHPYAARTPGSSVADTAAINGAGSSDDAGGAVVAKH